MKVTHDVIKDLWPLYECGEVSNDTHELVEEFLRQNPDFAPASQRGEFNKVLSTTPNLTPPADLELKVIRETKKMIQKRSYLLAMSTFVTAIFLALTLQQLIDCGWSLESCKFHDAVTPSLFAFLACIAWFVFIQSDREMRKMGL